jgi:hypothetical protein
VVPTTTEEEPVDEDIWRDPPVTEHDFWTGEYYEDGMARGVRYVKDWMGRTREIEIILPDLRGDLA